MISHIPHDLEFPIQRVGYSEKQRPSWYANCIDYVISAGTAYTDRRETELKLNILHGNIPDSFYKKTLNPYNSAQEKYKRFPATMRNLDIMNDIVRRYIGEYAKGVHQFVVGANNPDIVLAKNAKLRQEILEKAAEAFKAEFERQYQQAVQQATQAGQPADSIDPNSVMPNQEEFMAKFNQDYIDKESKQGQDMLEYIQSMTKDSLIYLSCYFDFVALGECYTYADVRDNAIIKEHVPVIDAFPIPNANHFIEDHDMFARRMMLSYQQIIDMFDEYLEDRDREFLYSSYGRGRQASPTKYLYSDYFDTYSDVCDKFSNEDRELFKKQPISMYDDNTNLYEVWHVVWRGEARRGILTHVNEAGLVEQTVVDEDYQFNKEAGDIEIEWAYEPQVYEGYRIGNRYTAIYPIKARPIAYNRNGKLPYNGVMEILPFMGQFSIIKLITPYQIMRNIISYHREMVIAKNKMLILLMPQSLIADDAEDKIYKMAADGTLLIDDSEDTNSQKMANIRMLNANMGQYITELTNLMEAIKQEAREMVDMNAQRYGQIAQSAGASTTQNAIDQSSTGSVATIQMFDEFRRTDYNRDLDYAKLAYIDGLDTGYWNEAGQRHYLSLDVNSYVNSDYGVSVRNDAKELDKIQQLRQWAFSAAQNGDLDMALAAITGDNVAQIKNTITKFTEIKRQHEEQMKQADQMLEQSKIQNELQKIAAQGEEDRKTEALKASYELQQKYIEVDMAQLGDMNTANDAAANRRLEELREQTKLSLEQTKAATERQKIALDAYNAAAERQVKREQMQNDLKIARTNKNKYDK